MRIQSSSLIIIILFMEIFSLSEASELAVGSFAPGFELLDQANSSHNLKDYQGKWVVLYFYPKDDTPGCSKEACAFRDNIAVLQSLNVEVFGVSVDNVDSHAKFAEKFSLQFPLLADSGGIIAKQYGALTSIGPLKFAKRHTFIIDENGKIAKIYRKVKPEFHSDEVIRDIKQLQQQEK